MSVLREVVFGSEDGMVSTLGALTGIAVGTSNHFTVVLAGFVIILVESISMAVGAYLSEKSEKEVEQRKLDEERIELREMPDHEREELVEMYERDGWPKDLSSKMAEVASKNEELFLKEMAYRELSIAHGKEEATALRGGVYMFFAYMIGGAIPLVPYIFLPIATAMLVSIVVTFTGLFLLGVATTRFTRRVWWRAGFEKYVGNIAMKKAFLHIKSLIFNRILFLIFSLIWP